MDWPGPMGHSGLFIAADALSSPNGKDYLDEFDEFDEFDDDDSNDDPDENPEPFDL